MAVFKSTFAGGKPKYGKKSGSARQLCHGIQLHDISVEIPTSAMQAGDGVLLYKWPDDSDAYLLIDGNYEGTSSTTGLVNNFRVDMDQIDSGAGLKWDMGVATSSDGVVDTVIINDQTAIGRAAGAVFADVETAATKTAAANRPPLLVSGKYLVFDPVTAPATAASGTIRVRFRTAYGLKPEVDSSLV